MSERPNTVYIEEDPSNPYFANAITRVIGSRGAISEELRTTGVEMEGVVVKIAERNVINNLVAGMQKTAFVILDADSNYGVAESDALRMGGQGHSVVLLTSSRSPTLLISKDAAEGEAPEWYDQPTGLTYVNKFEIMESPTIKGLKALLTPPPAEDTV